MSAERDLSLRVAGIVLCGGRSQRMGRPKAWLPFGAELMLPRVARLLGEAVAPVIAVAAPGQEPPPLPTTIEVVYDAVEGRGPLQGLSTGLHALAGRADAAFVTACDAPLLRPRFIRRMIDLLGPYQVAVPHIAGFFHPLAAVYRTSIAPEITCLLAEQRLRLIDLFDRIPTRLLEAHELTDVDPDLHSLRNCNTPADYAAALGDDVSGLGG